MAATPTPNESNGNSPTDRLPAIGRLAVPNDPICSALVSAEKSSCSRFWMMMASPKETNRGANGPRSTAVLNRPR